MLNDNPSPVYDKKEAASKATAPHEVNEGPHLYASIEEGIEAMREMAKDIGADEIFITGGGQIYKETLPYTQRLYITVLDRPYEADVFFPQFDWNEWDIVEEEKHASDEEKDRPSFTFYTLERT